MIESKHKDIRTDKIKIDGPVVYAIYDDKGECAYVGQTQDANRRFKGHTSSPKTGWRGNIGKLFLDGPRDYKVEIYSLKEVLDRISTERPATEPEIIFDEERKIFQKSLGGAYWPSGYMFPFPVKNDLLVAEEFMIDRLKPWALEKGTQP